MCYSRTVLALERPLRALLDQFNPPLVMGMHEQHIYRKRPQHTVCRGDCCDQRLKCLWTFLQLP